MRDWIAGAMTVLGTLLVLSGAATIILRAWSSIRAEGAGVDSADPAATPTTTSGSTLPTSASGTTLPTSTSARSTSSAERGANALVRLGPPERLILWGCLLLVLAAITAGAIGFELGASATAK